MAEADTNWVRFTRTHWTLVLSVQRADSRDRHQALESLCHAYWPPIYAYIRQKGYPPADAQDLTQEFFARLLAKDYLQHLVHQRGQFRSFLLTFVNHMLNDEHDRCRAQKRGGTSTHIPLQAFESWEAEVAQEASESDLELSFDRMWARTILKRAGEQLEAEYSSRGKADLFLELKTFASGTEEQPAYAALAAKLGSTEVALRAAVHRMRVRYGQLIREEVIQTVAQPDDLEEEIRHLIRVVSKT